MAFTVKSGRKITLPLRFRDGSDANWGNSEGSESSGDDGDGKSVENVGISNEVICISKINKTKISNVKGKKSIKKKSIPVGKVNEGASTSTGNVLAPSFYRPDLPNPNLTKNKRKNKNLDESYTPPTKKLCKSKNKGSRVNNSVRANVKGSAVTARNKSKELIVYNWLDMDTPVAHIQRDFVHVPILPFPVTNHNYQPVDFFDLLFDNRVFDVILAETNHFASNCTASTPISGWVDLTGEELAAFLGIMIGTSFMKISRLEDIWHPDWLRGLPHFAKIMSKARFFQIKHNLHFNDNCQTPEKKNPMYKLHKIEPIITICTENFRENYQLHQEVSVDESITRFKGRQSMKQYDASKPIKRGFKWWTLADSSSGYVYNMKLYTGRDKPKKKKKTPGQTGSSGPCVPPIETEEHEASVEQTTVKEPKVVDALGTRAVLSVISPHLDHKNHVVFVDRFFSSLPIMQKLSDKGIYICGTIQKGRIGIPECIKDVNLVNNLERGESHYVVERDTGVQLVLWQDRKPIYFTNNFYPCEGVDFVSRRNPDGSKSQFPCPPAVLAYNRYMNGVDRADQIRQIYSIDRRSKRWPMRLFWHCVDTCIANAYILYRDYLLAKGYVEKKIPDQLDFRTSIVRELIGDYTSRKRVGRPSLHPPPLPRLDNANHKIVDLRLHGVPKRKCCVVCLKRKLRK